MIRRRVYGGLRIYGLYFRFFLIGQGCEHFLRACGQAEADHMTFLISANSSV